MATLPHPRVRINSSASYLAVHQTGSTDVYTIPAAASTGMLHICIMQIYELRSNAVVSHLADGVGCGVFRRSIALTFGHIHITQVSGGTSVR